MNCSLALDILMSRLGDRTEASLRNKCLLEMILLQEKLQTSPWLPWFMVSEDATTIVEAGERRVPVPSDFVMELEEGSLYISNDLDEKVPLNKDDYDTLINKYGFDTQATLAAEYALVGEYFHLFPISSLDRTLRMKYFQKLVQPLDNANSENGWFRYAPDLMIAGAGYEVATKHLRDVEVAGLFAPDIAPAHDRLRRLHHARIEANRMRQMGED